MVTVRVVPFLVILVALSATGKSQSKLTNAETPLSLEELKLYGGFLDSFLHTHAESTSVGLSERTVPLLLGPGDTDECSQGIGFPISKAVDQRPRPFPATITKSRPLHLVDPTKTNPPRPQEKVLSLSKIGFDDEHQFAVFTFKLVQVGANGFFHTEGGTLLFRITDGKWTPTKKVASVGSPEFDSNFPITPLPEKVQSGEAPSQCDPNLAVLGRHGFQQPAF